MIAFVSDRDGNNEIYLMNADGSGLVNLTNSPANDGSPAWSPDGLRIAFTSDRDGNNEIYVMDADGGNPVNVTSDAANDFDPSWSPDGRHIAFGSDGVAVPSGIFVVDANGGGRLRLTQADTGLAEIEWALSASDGSPAWAPAGDRIAFVRTFDGPTPLATAALVYTIASDGSGGPISFAAGAWSFRGIDWSPDGRSLAAADVTSHEISSNVILFTPSGEIRIPTPGGDSHMVSPAISPDGTRLAAAVYDINGTPSDIHVMSLDGSDPVNVTNHVAWDSQPTWQPVNPIPIGVVDSGSGRWYLRHPSGAVTMHYFGAPGDRPLMGDWNCDGTDTSGVYRPSDRAVFLRNSNTTGAADRWFVLGTRGGVPLSGDWNGDGCDTIAVFQGGRVAIANALPTSGETLDVDQYYWFGLPADQPFAGDFNGDGKDTIGLHRMGAIFLNEIAPTGPIATTDRQFWYGSGQDIIFADDWTGSSADTVGCFRRGGVGKFFFRFTNTTGPADREYFNFFGDDRGFDEVDFLPVSGEFGLER